ncbi:hypothetical protein BA177_01080 [Woeseia oceani]|uniref:Cobalt transporter n=1 Tax=Woeseia oceani TaxID=1548547 RepID=A0A193LC74_9GAMM|nr:hypothetical protein BA177_01080 [Woeseia oceani]
MQHAVCQLVLISVLFLSLDSAADRVSDGHPHGGMDDVNGTLALCLAPTLDDEEHNDIDENHCEHCCHGHASSIAMDAGKNAAPNPAASASRRLSQLNARDGTAPPTPPPNA